ncbi:transcription factor bHLH131-like protein [Actinidia rufa]|uniref:Transcription factor bHLH131-like protein n=1 Tax=Actinidia rufa TaxID=165716 RepID=A0A7J0EWC6_9ERIC|nr:transcription factor bHLH131-like protein [Actinidia rufa]
MYEELKSCMKEKEAIIKNLGSLNYKLRDNYNEKIRKWDEEKQELLVALDEANSKNTDQEQKLHACKEEVRGLKLLLSALEKKCLEAEEKAKASKELRQRDDMLLKQEKENRKVEDQLKWKKEQFKHLDEAYEKLRNQLQASTKEWEREKSTLQTDLDSQTRVSEDLHRLLQMCNQALAHEESRRKYLEVQLSETKTCFDNVFVECQEAKSEIECLTGQRDKDIASLRDLLGTEEMIHKEMKYQLGILEQENQELRFSLEELQEAQIQEAGNSSSLLNLRNKLKGLEQMHRNCSKNLRAKEAEWTAKFDKMTGDLTDCRSELESKDRDMEELKMKLEGYCSLIMHLELKNEEKFLMLLVLKSGILEAKLKLDDEKADMDRKNSEREEEVSLLIKELEMKSDALVKAEKTIAEDHEQQLQLQDELERHEEKFKESWGSQLRLKEKALQMEIDLVKVHDALNRANDELAEFCETNELEFELQIWRFIAERLKANLEENHQLHKQVEVSLLACGEVEVTLKQEKESLGHAVEEKDRRIDDLETRIVLLDRKLNTREKGKEKEKISGDHQREIECLEQERVRRELEGAILAYIDAERIYEHERENFHRLVEEKNQRIADIHLLTAAEKQTEVNLLHKAWEKIAADEFLKEIAIQEQRLVIEELEDDFRNLETNLEALQKIFTCSKEEREKIVSDLRTSDVFIDKLESEKRTSVEDVKKLLSDRDSLLNFVTIMSERICEFSIEDMQLMGVWERIQRKIDDSERGVELKGG